MLLVLRPEHYLHLVGHAMDAAPKECCGLLAGYVQGDRSYVEAVVPSHDLSHSTEFTYHMPMPDQARLFKAIRNAGLDLLGIYHSHPTSPPYPSGLDLEQWNYPELLQVIISLQGPDIAAFTISGGIYTLAGLAVESTRAVLTP